MNYLDIYTSFLRYQIKLSKPLKAVFDASNGATGSILRKTFDGITNLTPYYINNTVDSEFPAHGPNPSLDGATKQAEEKVLETKSDFGVVYDADGDRAIFIDNMGKTTPSYVIAALLYRHAEAPYIADETVYDALNYIGIFKNNEVLPSKVGFVYVREQMKKHGASVGAELSGHYSFKDFFYCDGAIFATIKIMNALEIIGSIQSFAKKLSTMELSTRNIETGNIEWTVLDRAIRNAFTISKPRITTRDGLTLTLPEGWVNIRPSNSEPLVRVVAGAPKKSQSSALVEKIHAII